MKPSAKVIAALRIIQKDGGMNKALSPRRFAELMWPNSPRWRNHTKVGRGVTIGGGMNLAGGGYLGRLRRAAFIETWYDGHVIHQLLTVKGVNLLTENKRRMD